MKIINKSKIPDALFRYLKQDLYDYEEKGESLSVTEILNPIQAVVLRRRHEDEIEVDAIDRLWILLGVGVHAILEQEKGIEKIERLKAEILGREISGKFDRIFNNKITDYKVTSAWTLAYRSRDEEWVWQLSIYRWLYWKVKKIKLDLTGSIVCLLRDWAEKNLTNPNYPRSAAVEVKFNLHDFKEVEEFLHVRVALIKKYEKLPDNKLLECSSEERWYNPKQDVYNRCDKYCAAAPFCNQLKREGVRK